MATPVQPTEDGMPSPPERVKVVEPATTEAADHRFPEKNPSGSEELEKLGVTENKAASTGNNEITLHGSKDPLSTVPKGNADREIQDVEMSKPVEAETAGTQDDADDDVSLAAGHDNTTQSSLSQAVEEQGPPCYQSSGPSDMEDSLEEEDEDEEIQTAVPSDANSTNMQYYQMKLSTFKKKATASLMKVIKTMFIIDTRIIIEQFHSKNDEPKDDQPIC
jgi:hypothetical protein